MHQLQYVRAHLYLALHLLLHKQVSKDSEPVTSNWKLTYTTEHRIIAFASDRRNSKPFEFQGVDFETEERVSADRLIC